MCEGSYWGWFGVLDGLRTFVVWRYADAAPYGDRVQMWY